jgi:hypothetical protein
MVCEAYSFCQTMKNKAGKALKSAPLSYSTAICKTWSQKISKDDDASL